MPYTKPVIRKPYYDCPIWIDNEIIRKEFICLSADSNIEDVELFLVHLFGYNNIDVKQTLKNSFNDLFKEEEVAILGGIAFFEDEKKLILPSCCCGLEDWGIVYDSIRNRISPWLGHDPNPTIIYHDNFVRVWSDDPYSNNKEKPYYIEFDYKKLLRCLEETRIDLLQFIQKPLFQWLYLRDQGIAYEMTERMKRWFMKGFI